MNQTLKDWVPPSVKKSYLGFHEMYINDKESGREESEEDYFYRTVMRSLATKKEMRTVWRRLDKRNQKIPHAAYDGIYDLNLQFAHEVCSIYLVSQTSEWLKLTQKNRENKLEELASVLESTSEMLKKYDIDFMYAHLLTNAELSYITNQLITNTGFKNIDVRVQTRTKKEYIKNITPTISDLLDRTKIEIKNYPPYEGLNANKPRAQSHNRTFFIRQIAKYNLDVYGTKLIEVIKLTTESVFDEKVSVDTVRNALKVGTN